MVPMLDEDGSRYIIVVECSFPNGDLNVYHRIYGQNNWIARVRFSIPSSDIALAKLE